MNAYELADDLESYDWYYEHEVTGSDGFTQEIKTCNTEYVWDAASMLRQQADRIAELEKETHSINYICPNCETHVELFYKTPQIKEFSDRELVVFLMDEIDRASEWLVDGETHMAIGVLGQCHAKIRKHLNNTKESE